MKWIFIAFCFCTINGFTQNTFSKTYDFEISPENLTWSCDVDVDKIIVLNHHTCYADENICTSISHLDFNGELQYVKVKPNFQMATSNALLINEDSLIMVGVEVEPILPDRYIDIIRSDKKLEEETILTIGNEGESALSVGIEKIDSFYYIYGNVYEFENESSNAQVIKLDTNLNIIWDKRYRYGGTLNYAIFLQPTNDGNLVFMNAVSVNEGTNFHIVKIDKDGNEISKYNYIDLPIHLGPVLLASQEGDYYFPSRLEPQIDFPSSQGRINKLNADMETLEWSFLLPADPFTNNRTHTTNQIIQADNGDIIACGSVWDAVPDNSQDSKWNGFVIRLSQEGEMLDYNIYKLPSDINPEELGQYKDSYLYGIQQTETGGFVAHGITSFKDIDGIHQLDMWILSIDENGCLDQYGCDETTILTSVNSPSLDASSTTVYPNPTSDFVSIDNKKYTDYRIFNNQGQLVDRGAKKEKIDVHHLPKGTYYLQLMDNKYIFQTEKFIRL